jgi:hypothetical protein
MIRVIAFAVCICSFLWIVFTSVQFRRAIREDLAQAHSELQRVDPSVAGDCGKVLNLYYESIYRDLPTALLPAAALMLGSTVLYSLQGDVTSNQALQPTADRRE